MTPFTRQDFDGGPMIVFYETTRACDLLCRHCRACAQPLRDPDELSSAQARALIDDLTRFPRPPLLVLTGGDPLKRADVFELVDYAVGRGLQVAMTPSATPLVTADAVRRLRDRGLHRLAVSLDGATAASHDDFRRVPGSFDRTLEIIADARSVGLPVQVNTTVARQNVDELEQIAATIGGLDIVLWSVFFLVPTGRATLDQRLTADEVEDVFERLWRLQRRLPFPLKTTEAPHYRRFVLQQAKRMKQEGVEVPPRRGAPPGMAGTNDGKGVLFVSHTGEIFPSGFLPIECGRFPRDSVVKVYQQAALFRALRDGDRLGGKCGACEYRHTCGGSRARTFGVTGDPLAAEPDCAYLPPAWTDSSRSDDHVEHHQPAV